MLKNILVALFLCHLAAVSIAQFQVTISPAIRSRLTNDSTQLKAALNSFFTKEDQPLSYLSQQLINFYPLGKGQYSVTVAFSDSAAPVQLRTFVASGGSGHINLTSPLAYLTKNWHTAQIGHIAFHYADTINLSRARAFEKNNETIAHKLGLTPENFDFYLTDNYQQILALQGYEFDAKRAGRTRDGSFSGDHQFFAIQHNEDFSHDLIHYYVSKIRSNTRNSAAEEGLAYYWGNAYYTDSAGNMIDYPAQLVALRNYESQHPDSSLLSLFAHNTKPFPTPELSARSILSARLFELIETTKGIEGIKALINSGPGDDNYFKAVESLTGVNRTNFDDRLRTLLAQQPRSRLGLQSVLRVTQSRPSRYYSATTATPCAAAASSISGVR